LFYLIFYGEGVHHALDGFLADVGIHHPFFLQTLETLAAHNFLAEGVLVLATKSHGVVVSLSFGGELAH